MDALVTASFLLVGWNTYSAIVVAKDTYTGKMPGPKSIGYSIAGLAGLTAFMLYTYGIAAEKHPELLEAEDRDEEERMSRSEAEDLAEKIEKMVEPYVDRVEVCGSYRRGSPTPGDLDVIIIPKKGITLPMMIEDIKPAQVNWLGEKKTQIVVDGHKIDFRVSSPKGWGAALLYFTGPAGYNIGMRMRAKKMGMKLNEYGIFDRHTDTYLGGATEDEIYKVLGKTPKTPAQRSKRAEQTFGRSKPDPNKCSQCGVIGETFTVTTRGTDRYFCGPICRYKYEGLAAESWQGISLTGSVDEIEEMLGRKKEAESQTFEAPRATYTEPLQQTFEKSYHIRAKKPLNKIVKDSLGGKLPSDDSRGYYYSRTTTMNNVTKEDYKTIQGYLSILNMAHSRFETTNSNWAGTDYAKINERDAVTKSIKNTPYLRNAVKHYHALDGLISDDDIIEYIGENMTDTDFNAMLAFIRYYDMTETGPYKGIRMVATDRAPYSTDGGYGNVYYNGRNPYDSEGKTPADFGTYDKKAQTLTFHNRDQGAVFTRLTKLRPYTELLPVTKSQDAYVEYCTDGGYGYRSSGSQCFRLTSFVCPENRGTNRNPDPGYSSRQTRDGWKYNTENWEEAKSAPYRYATIVYLPTQKELQEAHGSGRELHRQTIIALYNNANKLHAAAKAAKVAKREEEEKKEKQSQDLARKNEAIEDLENATKSMQETLKVLVRQARNAGVDEDDIYDALEHTLYDIEEMIEDWEPSDYWDAEGKKDYGCKKCGTGPHKATIVEDKVFVLCPDCGLVGGSEDATAWNVTWTKDTPKVLHERPFADVEWDTTSEE